MTSTIIIAILIGVILFLLLVVGAAWLYCEASARENQELCEISKERQVQLDMEIRQHNRRIEMYDKLVVKHDQLSDDLEEADESASMWETRYRAAERELSVLKEQLAKRGTANLQSVSDGIVRKGS